jgi:hypothetical protein
MDVDQRYREDQAVRQTIQPAFPPLPASGRPTADDVVAVVDRLQERLQVRLCPGLSRRGDQDQRMARALQPIGEQASEVRAVDGHDTALDWPPELRQVSDQRCDDGLRVLARQVGQQDDPNPGVG